MSDNNESIGSLLDSCRPSKALEAKQAQRSIIKRPSQDEAILITPHHAELACLAVAQAPKDAPYQGETYHPLPKHLQEQAGNACKRIVFHLCVSITGEHFLLPQKLPGDNTWNKSMEGVIEAGRQGPIKITSNQELKQYQAEESQAVITDNTTVAGLHALCDQAFSELVIDQPDHPALLEARGISDIYGGY